MGAKRQTEMIEWITPDDEMPDSDMTVFVTLKNAPEDVWIGWNDGENWRNVSDGMPISVTAWANIPQGYHP